MGNFAAGARTICPFYIKESNLAITCEGLVGKTNTAVRFDVTKDKQMYQAKCCESYEYEQNCPLAAALMKEKFTNSKRKFTNSKQIVKIGERLVAGRQGKRISQRRLAAMAYISAPYLCQIEKDQKYPSLITLVMLASALGMDVAELLVEEENER